MERVAARSGSRSPALTIPTFNSRPIRANSSDRVQGYGVLPERSQAYRKRLDAETIRTVEQLAGDLYDRTAALGIA